MRKVPATSEPDQPERLQHRRALVLHRSHDRAHADREQERQPEHDAGMAQREPETGGQRAGALADQLAGGVVDHGDVVGVERVPHSEQVGGHARVRRRTRRPIRA